jgi:hypothetical protein
MSATALINAAQKVDVRDECASLGAVRPALRLGARRAAPPSAARHTAHARSEQLRPPERTRLRAFRPSR